jgi:hypothetical protein
MGRSPSQFRVNNTAPLHGKAPNTTGGRRANGLKSKRESTLGKGGLPQGLKPPNFRNPSARPKRLQKSSEKPSFRG